MQIKKVTIRLYVFSDWSAGMPFECIVRDSMQRLVYSIPYTCIVQREYLTNMSTFFDFPSNRCSGTLLELSQKDCPNEGHNTFVKRSKNFYGRIFIH